MKRSFYTPVFSRYTVFCDDREQFMRALNAERRRAGQETEDTPDDLHTLLGLCDNAGNTVVMGVFVRDVYTLAHEAVHAARTILQMAGCNLDLEDDDEPLAYLTDWLMAEWCRRMGWKITVRTK